MDSRTVRRDMGRRQLELRAGGRRFHRDRARGVRLARSARAQPLNLAAIALLPLSGIANLIFVAREHRFRLPAVFVEVLSAKLLLLCGMAAALAIAWGTAARLGSGAAGAGERRLLWLYGAMAAMGAVALMLGLWLAGGA